MSNQFISGIFYWQVFFKFHILDEPLLKEGLLKSYTEMTKLLY